MNRNDQQFIVQKIRAQYMPKDSSLKDLDRLRELDAQVKRPANVFGYIFGSIGAIVMGAGMSLVMTDIGTWLGMDNAMIPGIAIGLVGMLVAIVNYPIYKSILEAARARYSAQILELSEKLMNKEGQYE